MKIQMKKLTKHVLFFIVTFILSSSFIKSSAQAPIISYTPSSVSLMQNSAMSPLTPANSGNPVTALAYGTPAGITGGGLNHPYGIALDPSGNVYVANYGNDTKDGSNSSISKYNPGTNTWTTFVTDSISNPQGIAFDASGNLYVLNYARTNNGNGNQHGNAYVTEYNPAGVLMTTVVAGLGTADGIAVDPLTGNLDIAEGSYNGGNTVVNEYTTGGALNFTISNAAIPNPVNVATDGSGNIFVLNNSTGGGTNQVVEFSSTGTYVSTLISTGLTNPFGIYVDGSGNIYVSDSAGGTNVIDVYNSTGTLLTTLNGLTSPQGLATDSKGNLYVGDYTNNTLTEYPATGGYFISSKLPPGLSFNYITGVISGTPTTAFASTTYTITGYNASGFGSTTVTLSCIANASAPTIVYNTFPVNVYTLGNLISPLIPTVTNASGATYSLTGTLPAGLSFSTTTGQITGTPSGATPKAATLYTVTVTNGGLTGSTNVSIATVIAVYWTGKMNSAWATKQNWSTNNVPVATDYVSIGEQPYTGNKAEPTISAGGVTVAYLALGSTHKPTLTVTGQTLTINNILTIDDNATPTITGTGNVKVAATGVINVAGTGTLTINSGLTFTLLSTATSSASVSEITAGAIIGQVSVQRYISAQRGYRLMASPVNAVSGVADANGNLPYSMKYVQSSVYITGTTLAPGGFDVSGTVTTASENPTLYLYREDVPVNNSSFISGNYRGVSSLPALPSYTYSLNNEGSAYTVPASNGFLFFFRGNRASASFDLETKTTFVATTATLTATGTLNQGQIVFRDWYTPTSTAPGFSNPSVTVEGFNLAANPYASTIDLDQYNTMTTTSGIYASNISQFIYELNPATSNYDTYEATSAGAIFTNNGGRYIASGQGFFVLATATGGQLIFNESAKNSLQQVTSPKLFLGLKAPLTAKTAAAKPLQMLRFEMALDTVNKDDILIMFDSNAQPGYKFNEDALYKIGAGKVSLSSVSNDNQLLSINKLPLSDGVTIPLKIGATAYATYTLNLKAIKGVPQLFDIWLKDAFTGDSVNMRTTPNYTFSITTNTASYGLNRFSVKLVEDPAYAYRLLTFNAAKMPQAKAVQVAWDTQYEGDYTNFTVERSIDNGKTFDVIGGLNATGQGTYDFVDAHPVDGINLYRLKQQDFNNIITYSKVVPVAYSNSSSTLVNNNLKVFPNPAKNNINLVVMNDVGNKGNYNITVTSSLGFVVKKSTTSQPNWQASISDLLPGTYLVKVFNNKDQSLVGTTKFVKL
jgi:sugar lactone lactonase YvrE